MKKIILFIFLFVLIIGTSVNAVTLNESMISSKIATGTTLKKYARFTDKGWLNIDVLEVDLTDKYTDITLLTSSEGVGKTQTLKSMINGIEENCIAAVNGDFFAASSGKGHSMGLAINNNELISSSYKGNLEANSYATFLLDDASPIYDFVTNKITLTSKKTKESVDIAEINKYPDDYNLPTIFTPAFGSHSVGSNENLQMTELVIKNDKVSEIRNNKEPVEIPTKGYVVSATGEGAEFLNDNFKVGTKVSLDIETSIDIDDIDFAISGGALLLENGKIPEKFSSNISGTHPRTALGTSKDCETLYLVTVDGRQKSSIGMSQQSLAEFLLEIDVYNAINLDGGGSTTMLARKLGDNALSTINSPSGGSLRAIINGIGILNDTPKSTSVSNIIIEVSDTNVFKNKSRKVTVKAYNKYFQPLEVDQDDVDWSYNGVPVTVKDGILTGDTVGMTMLKAKYNKKSAEIEINVLSDPHELLITPKNTSISSGKKVAFNISAKNKNGYYSTLDSDEVTFKIEKFVNDFDKESRIPTDATLNDNTFTATTCGEYIISVCENDVKSYALVTVNSEDIKITNTVILPKSIKGTDELQKFVELENDDSFRISIFDNINTPNLMLENLVNKKLVNLINNESEVSVFTSQEDEKLLENIKTKKVMCKNYSKSDYNNSTFITVNALNSGIRDTDSNQWLQLKDDIKNAENENIFIVMNNSLDNFSDSAEARLFIDTLCELKRETRRNIWVIHKGQYTDFSMERGIKYLGINSSNDELLDTKYILITVNGTNLSYEIKNIF